MVFQNRKELLKRAFGTERKEMKGHWNILQI
jgi:hypothetical protein